MSHFVLEYRDGDDRGWDYVLRDGRPYTCPTAEEAERRAEVYREQYPSKQIRVRQIGIAGDPL